MSDCLSMTTITTEIRKWQKKGSYVYTCSMELKTARHVTSSFPLEPFGLLPLPSSFVLRRPIDLASNTFYDQWRSQEMNASLTKHQKPWSLCTATRTGNALDPARLSWKATGVQSLPKLKQLAHCKPSKHILQTMCHGSEQILTRFLLTHQLSAHLQGLGRPKLPNICKVAM